MEKDGSLQASGGEAAGERHPKNGSEVILLLVRELIVMGQTNLDFSKLKPRIMCTTVKSDCDMFNSDPSRF